MMYIYATPSSQAAREWNDTLQKYICRQNIIRERRNEANARHNAVQNAMLPF
jgi:hypothetical protein